MTRTETKGERKRTTTTKQNTSNSSYILSLGTKPFVIFKTWFNRFFLGSGMKIEFSFSLELNNDYLYSLGHKEKIDLFVSFALKCDRTSVF